MNKTLKQLAPGYIDAYNSLAKQARVYLTKSKEYPQHSSDRAFYMSLYNKLRDQANECKKIAEICEHYYDRGFYIGDISSPKKFVQSTVRPERTELK